MHSSLNSHFIPYCVLKVGGPGLIHPSDECFQASVDLSIPPDQKKSSLFTIYMQIQNPLPTFFEIKKSHRKVETARSNLIALLRSKYITCRDQGVHTSPTVVMQKGISSAHSYIKSLPAKAPIPFYYHSSQYSFVFGHI